MVEKADTVSASKQTSAFQGAFLFYPSIDPSIAEGIDMSGNRREPMGTDLIRQRRNLLVISLGLVAVQLAGATFDSKVSIFGEGITFGHPERLLTGAWVSWTYFLLRYFQYLHEEPDLGLRQGMQEWIHLRYGDHSHNASPEKFSWQSWWRWEICEVHGNPPDDGDWGPAWPKEPRIIALETVRAFTFIAIRTPRFTDYLLPVLVALLPLALKVGEWVTAL